MYSAAACKVVLVFPGTNCGVDATVSCQRILKYQVSAVSEKFYLTERNFCLILSHFAPFFEMNCMSEEYAAKYFYYSSRKLAEIG